MVNKTFAGEYGTGKPLSAANPHDLNAYYEAYAALYDVSKKPAALQRASDMPTLINNLSNAAVKVTQSITSQAGGHPEDIITGLNRYCQLHYLATHSKEPRL